MITDNRVFVKGKVEETLEIAHNIPNTISFLRLNPDWYESKKKELERLHENLVTGGITIVDVYSAWNGTRKAVDEFSRNSQCHLLSMIDIDARIGVKGR